MPSARTRLVGRADELDRALGLLLDPTVRLVTVTGRSGVGKTVLAQEVVRRLLAETSLATTSVVADHGSGPSSVARVLAALEGGAEGGAPVVGGAPDGRRRVVLLDGFDELHATEESAAVLPLVSQALDEHPDLTVLATSTAPLRLRGEHLVRLAPLAVPDARATDPTTVAAAPAAALLAELIAAHDPSFSIDAIAAAPAATICRALDGLPLALELVAPTCATLGLATVGELFAEGTPFSLVADGPTDADERHRDLRSTVAWSCSLLTEDQQRSLRALSTFADTFSLDAARVLADELGPGSTVEAIEHLVTVGLVDRTSPPGGPARYRLAATIRAFAREEAERLGELLMLRARHAEHYRALARESASAFGTSEGIRLHDQALADLEEHLVAFDAAAQGGPSPAAIRYGTDLAPVWIDAGMAEAGISLLSDLLDAFEPEGTDQAGLAAEAWAWATALAVMSGSASPATVRSQLERLRATVEAEPAGDVDSRLLLFEMQLQAHIYTGDLDRAIAVADEAVELAAAPRAGSARVLSLAAVVANQTGDLAAAIDRASRARALALDLGDERQAFRSAMVLGGIPGATEVPSPEALLETARRIGDHTLEGPAAIIVALDRAMAADLDGAADALAEALEQAQRRGYWHVEELAVLALAVIAAAGGRFDDVAVLHGGVRRHLPTLRRFLSPSQLAIYDAAVEATRAAAGEATFDRGVAAGEMLAWHQVLALSWDLVEQLRQPEAGAQEQAAPWPPEVAPLVASGATPELRSLTERERAVLDLLSKGLTNKAIATELGLRPKTVMHHTSSIYRKLGVATRTEAAAALLRTAPAG